MRVGSEVAFALIVGFLVVQVVVGLVTDSLALLSDAGHMATDALGLGMALAAITAAEPSGASPTTARSACTAWRSSPRWRTPCCCSPSPATCCTRPRRRLSDPPEIASLPVLVVGVLGLAVNVVAFLLLREEPPRAERRGAYLEVRHDMLGSVGVIVAAGLMWLTGWTWVDPVVGAAIGLFILPRACRLGRDAFRVLVQAAPAELSTSTTSQPTSRRSTASSTCTICTCGRSPARWRC